MEFSFYFYSGYSIKTIHDGILDFIKNISVKEFRDYGYAISYYPIQIWFGEDSDIQSTNGYTKKTYGFNSNQDYTLYVFSKSEEDDESIGIAFMFKVINLILTKFEVKNFVLEDPSGPWIMKSINGKKQMRDTDVFEYPFELVECSSEFERCEAERYG